MVHCLRALLFFLIPLAFATKDHQIGQRSVLLPIDYGATHRVQHLMEAYGGCYAWTTNQPSILRIQTLTPELECESRALIEVQREGAFEGPLTISATDKETGQIIRAYVRLAKLHRIEVLTKFRIMNLHQIQEFYLIGYDEHGNSFSSLEGLKFQWTIDQQERVAERITIKESNIFQQTNYRRSLEEMGYETDMLVIRTLNIGEVQLTVRLNEPKYEHISTSIRLFVQERFDIVPSSLVYMLTGSKLRFSLVNAKGQKIKVPTPYYQYSLGDGFTVSEDLSVVSPSFETIGKLVVRDTRTQPPYTNQVEIHNLHADRIEIIAKSYIIVGQQEPFKVSLFNNRRLLKGSATVKVVSDFHLNMANSSFLANSKGAGIIKATFEGLVHEKRIIANLRLKAVLIGNKIVLPPGQTFQLKVLGGSGSYDFSLIDSQDTAYVNQNGIISAKNPGKARIIVVDNNDPSNKVEVDLVVESVRGVRSFDQKLEAGVGDEVTVLAIAQPENERQYTQCNELPISILQNDLIEPYSKGQNTLETIIKIHHNARQNPELRNVLDIFRQGRDYSLNDYRDYVVHSEISLQELEKILFLQDNFGICKAVKAKPLVAREGEAHFKILNQKNYTSTPFKLKIFDYLAIQDHISNRILLVPGSHFVWRATQTGGEESIYYLNENKVRDGQPIVLTCTQPGEVREYSIKIIHPISQRLPRPYSRSLKITVECLEPSALKFKANDNIIQNGQLSTVNDESFVIQLRGFDHLGREFYNISTLDFNWNLKALKKTDLSPKDNIYKFDFTSHTEHPNVNVRTSGSKSYGISFPEIEANLDILRTKGFRLMLKNRSFTQYLTLVATPNNKQFITIVDGSGNFEVKCLNPELMKCNLNSHLNTIQVTPLKRGNTKMIVTDLQQYGRPTLEVNVKILNPTRLRLRSNSSLVQQGSAFRLEYQVYGEDDLLIDSDQYQYLNIVPKHSCQLEQIDSKTFRALKRGQCSISASMPYHSLASENTVQIQVFPKFSINVPYIVEQQKNGIKYYVGETRVPLGCNSTLMFLGGPFGVGKLTYEMYPSNILQIEELNLRTFRLVGRKKGTLDLKFTLRDGENDISVVSLKVTVKDIDSVELAHHGNRQIHEKATVRLIPQIIIDGERALSSKCPIKYSWKTDNQDVLEIKGWDYTEAQDNIGLNITGIKRGFAKIQLTPIYGSKHLPKQQVVIQVIETPAIDLSTYIHHRKVHPTSLLIPPNSGYTLNASYQVDIVTPCQKLIKVVGNNIETFNDKGGSVVKLRTENRDHSVTYMSVHIERIHSVFIENPLSKLSLQVDTEVKIPFYVQDSFGRLFPNNLKGVNYEVRVSNPLVSSAQLSEDKQYIVLRGLGSGLTELYLSIAGQPDIYDVVPVETLVLITPVSPVAVHVGGTIEFKALKGSFGQWTSQNPFIIQIDKRTGKALALREGSTQISYNYGIQYKSRVNVFRTSDIVLKETRDTMTNYKGEEHSLPLVVLVNKGAGAVELRDINRPLAPINNNLVVKCQPKHPLWFQVQCSIQNVNDYEQMIYAYPKVAKMYPSNEQMPQDLEFEARLQSGSIGETIFTKQLSHPFHFEFRVPKIDHYISLNAREKSKTIQILTNTKLGVYSQYSKVGWLSTEFVPERSVQIIKIDMRDQTESVKPTIKIMNHITKQSDQITVSFSPLLSFSSRGGLSQLFGMRWSWTSWIILLMTVVICLLFVCACFNRDYVFYAGKED